MKADRQRVGFRFQLDIKDHFTRLGELQRVADEIDDDLPKSAGVGSEQIRHCGIDVAGQLNFVTMSSHSERLERVAKHVAQPERPRIELQATGLNFRKVQDIVDHAEQ